VRVADAIIEKLGIEPDLHEALRGMLNPDNRGTMSPNKFALAERIKSYIIQTWGSLDPMASELSTNELIALRKFTGVSGTADRLQYRPPQQLTDINKFAGNQVQKDKTTEALHSGLLAIFSYSPETPVVDTSSLSPVELVTRAGMGETVFRESWLEAAEIVVKCLGRELSLNAEELRALWQRAHRNGNGAHTKKEPELTSALAQLQPVLIRYRAELDQTDRPLFAVAGKFTAPAFGGPYDLDQIDQSVPRADAEKDVMLAFALVLQCLQDEARGK